MGWPIHYRASIFGNDLLGIKSWSLGLKVFLTFQVQGVDLRPDQRETQARERDHGNVGVT